MTSPLYSELPQELLLDVEPMRPAAEEEIIIDNHNYITEIISDLTAETRQEVVNTQCDGQW